jgi:ribonuclease Z
MKKLLTLGIAVFLSSVLTTLETFAKPDSVDGQNVPEGRIPQEIKGNKYPRTYFPGTEKLGKREMRITALGTGMPNQSPSNVAASFLVELGNGDSFIFDIGTGSTDRLAGLESDYSKLDKVFASHLHTDHVGDLATLWVAGWINGRYEPLNIYGPSGKTPELGLKAHVDHIRAAWAWDVTSRAGTLPNAGGEIIAHEFDFSKTQVVYNENGVKITSFPAIHIRDGSVSYRLDWKGLSFVFGGDSAPNKWFVKEAKGADVVVHECFFTGKLDGHRRLPLQASLLGNQHNPYATAGLRQAHVRREAADGRGLPLLEPPGRGVWDL